MDKMNLAILRCLRANARASWQQIGREVHLSGQALAARVQDMEAQGVISGYTVQQDQLPRHFVTVFLKSADFAGFEDFARREPAIEQAHKVSGEGCYHLTVQADGAEALAPVLSGIERFGTHRVLSTLRAVK